MGRDPGDSLEMETLPFTSGSRFFSFCHARLEGHPVLMNLSRCLVILKNLLVGVCFLGLLNFMWQPVFGSESEKAAP